MIGYVYFSLFNGRKDPDKPQPVNSEGGPTFGPFDYVRTEHAVDVILRLTGCGEASLHVINDMLYYSGFWFSDWAILGETSNTAALDNGEVATVFEQAKAMPPGTVHIKRAAGDFVDYPPVAWEFGALAAETYRREESVKLAKDAGIPLCVSCYAAEGEERVDNALACGIHCDECFEQMVRACRQQSW